MAQPRFTRRGIVASGAAILAAGCQDSDGENTDNEPQDNDGGGQPSEDPFGDIEVGTELTIPIEDDDVDAIRVVGPDGSAWSEQPVDDSGVVSIDLIEGYPSGEQTIEGHNPDGDVIGSDTITIEPEIEVSDFGFSQEFEQLAEQDGAIRSTRPVVEVENTGSGPDEIRQIQVDGDHVSDYYKSGPVVAFDAAPLSERGRAEETGVAVPPNETNRARVDREVASPESPCDGEVTFKVTVKMAVSESQDISVVASGEQAGEGPGGDDDGVSLQNLCDVETRME